MKDYFKYANGYVNINDDNLFLTNSGNWSETKDLLEKSPKSIRRNNFKAFRIYIFLFIIASLILLVLSKAKSGSIPFGLVLLGLGAFAYLKRETGKRYKIPISKITSIEISKDSVKIIFSNAADKEDFEVIERVEEKGIAVLNELASILKK